jgi:putative endonuclease
MYYVYIIECNDGTLYTGYTTSLEERIKAHNKGIGAKYTRGRLPVKLCYYEVHSNKSDALKREINIKRLTRKKKLKLIKGD